MSRGFLLPEYNQLMRYTINDVCNWLAENKFGEFVRQFREHGIDGNRFVTLTDLDMTKMGCQMNKRKDLLKLIKDIPKPTETRYKRAKRILRERRHTVVSIIYQSVDRVKNIVQTPVPATPTRDYNAHRGRPPAPVPVAPPPQNGVSTQDDDDSSDSGPEDDYQWDQDDFSDVSSSDTEDYENAQDTPGPPSRPQQEPDQDDSDSAGSYEEPDPQQSPPPPNVPKRGAAQVPPSGPPRPTNHGLPMNRRPVQPNPIEEQPAYEETSNESEQPVYADPEEERVPQPVKKTARKQLPVPDKDVKTSSLPRKGMPPTPMRTTSEPEVPAPPPPRGQKGKKVQEPSVPAPPPPRGGRKAQKAPPPVPQEPDDVYEDPDNSAPPTTGHQTGGQLKSPPQNDFEKDDVYEDPDNSAPPTTGHQTGGQLKPPPQNDFEQDDVYEDPDNSAPPTTGHQTGGQLKPPPQNDFEQEDYIEPQKGIPMISKGGRRSPMPPFPKIQPQEDTDIQEEFYEDPDAKPVHSSVRNSALPPLPNRSAHPISKPQPVEIQEDYIEPQKGIPMISKGGRRSPMPPFPKIQPQEDTDIQEEFYEDPDAKPVHSSVRNSALPPLPNRSAHPISKPQPVEIQEVYEDPDQAPQLPPSRNHQKSTQPAKASHMPPKKTQNTKKAPPPQPEEFEQLEYEVPEEILKGEMPVSDYMEMQQRPEEQKQVGKKVEAKGQKLPPRPGPGGKSRQLPVPPQEDKSIPPLPDNTKKQGNRTNKPLPQPVDNTPSLEDQHWYHGDVDRQVADNKLTRVGTNGCYLIRRSKKGGETKPYTLAIFYDAQVFNLNIRKKGNSKYALGLAKAGEQEFSELSELVSFFNSHRLILAKGQTRLKKPCPK